MNGYLALVLDEDSKKVLLEKLPPRYKNVYSHHVTVVYEPTEDEYNKYKDLLGKTFDIQVVGYTKDDKCDAAFVRVPISIKNAYPHITLSTNNIDPVYSNELLKKGYREIKDFTISGVLEFLEL